MFVDKEKFMAEIFKGYQRGQQDVVDSLIYAFNDVKRQHGNIDISIDDITAMIKMLTDDKDRDQPSMAPTTN